MLQSILYYCTLALGKNLYGCMISMSDFISPYAKEVNKGDPPCTWYALFHCHLTKMRYGNQLCYVPG
jgi:hypothetical protein